MLRLRFCISLLVLAAVALPMYGQPVGFWKEQPIEVPVRSLMGISMADTGLGYAVGDVDVLALHTGILIKRPGDPTWRKVPANVFNPPLTIALSSWAQDVHAIPNTGIAYISWRDDYRSLVYKTTNAGASWFSVSPLNPILYGTRYAVTFINEREGIIVGEGPGRVHRTLDGGVSWTSYSLPVNPPLTDAKHSGSYWLVAGGDNTFFRYNSVSNRWINLSFQHSTEYFPTHLKVHFINDNYGYLSGYNQNNPVHVMKTTNGGINWDPVGNQPPFGPTPGGHKGVFFFDTLKGWVMSNHDEIAYTEDGGISWYSFQPQLFGGKPYPPANKMVFLNEAFGWAVGGAQRDVGYPTVSHGWIMKWTGTQKPDISTTPVWASFDTMACQEEKIIRIPIQNSGTGSLTIVGGQITFSHPEFSLRGVTWPIIIAPGATYEAEVAWAPDVDHYGPPPVGARMTIESNDPDHNPWTVQLGGDRVFSRLTTRVTSLVFPTVCRNEASEATVAVESFGNLPPRIIKVELFSNRGSVELISHVIGDPITGSDVLRFVLRSDTPGSLSGKLLITAGNTLCPDVIEIPFQVLIQSNEVEVIPDLLQFGDVCAGDETVQYLRLTNRGNVPAHLREIRRSGADSLFTLEVDTTLQITSGGFALLALRFAPSVPDSFSSSAQFRLVFEPCADTVTIVSSGRGVEAFIELDTDSLLVVGPAPLGREVITSISLRNTGFLPTVIEEVWFEPAVPGLRLLAPLDLPDTLRPKEDIEVRFAYEAQQRDSVETMLRVRWSDPCGGELAQPVLLITDEMPIAELPGALIFDEQTCEEDVIDSVEVRNTGQKPLAIFTATVTGGDAAHFRVLGPPLPVTVDPGKSVWIVLAYNAPMNGGSSAALVVNHNDLTVRGESRVVLNGRKKVNTLTVVGDTLGVLTLCPGVTGSRRFLLRNDNAEVLLLSSVELLRGSPFVTLRHGPVPGSVAPGSAFELWADVTLPYDTTIEVELRIVTDPCRAVYTLRFRAVVPVPRLRIEPDPLDLGIRPVSDTGMVAVRLINDDSIDVVIDTLVLGGVASAMYIATPLPSPRTLAPGESVAADLKLRLVKDSGRVAGTLCVIVSVPCPDTLCFDVSARFISTPFAVTADTLRYTFAFCDTVLCDTVRIVNVLSVPQRVFPSVNNPAVFSVEPDTATLLEPGDAMTFRICARRPQTAIARGELLLQSDVAPTSTVALVAQREDRDLVLPDTLDAGNIPYCESERTMLLRMENRNNLDESIFDIISDDPSFSVLTPLPFSVRARSTDTIILRYRPAAPGAHIARLTIRSRSGHCERSSTVIVAGRRGEAYLETDPSSLLFANVVAGTAQSRSLRVSNRDMEGLVLAAIAVQPAGVFSASVALPQPLPPGGALDIPVVFLPDSARNYFGSLCLIFSAPCADTLCIALEGA
ncbi:MAG: choice-of-anchor D domain-containing protein, partial [Bacteroidetes bacterium]|nr:choice-of-anchor D domain-containing protein [Bacteroidota bacterium]